MNKATVRTAIILAGGKGFRLQSIVSDLPKPMAPIGSRPFLEILLDYLEKEGINKVYLSVGYKAKTIKDYFSEKWGRIELEYVLEREPLGTGGAIQKALRQAKERAVFVINGDTYYNIRLPELEARFNHSQSDIAIAMKFEQDSGRYGSLDLDENNRVSAFHEKKNGLAGWINAGIYLVKTEAILDLNMPESFSFEKDLMEKYPSKLKIYGWPSDGYFIDIGIPEDYKKAQWDLRS